MNRKHQEHITLQLKKSISSSRNYLTISICIVVFSVFAFVKSNHCKDKDIEGDEALDKRWGLFRVAVTEIFPWLRNSFSINVMWIYALTILLCTDSVYFNVETEWELGSYWTCIFDKSIYIHRLCIFHSVLRSMSAVGKLTNTEHAELLLEKKYESEFYIRIPSLVEFFWTQPFAMWEALTPPHWSS